MKKIIEGTMAPEFTSIDQDGHTWRLADHRGGFVLLYFYPKDFTPGCTIEAQEFQKIFDELKKKVTIIGISADSVESHKKFCNAHGLEFTLLADPQKEVTAAYGADGILLTRRSSFLVDGQGIVRKIYDRVDPKTHASQILADVVALGA
ncbi:MAG: peroxiredoxin [Candidatus Paceibacterota bacterium]